MQFLTPNQQCRNTECKNTHTVKHQNVKAADPSKQTHYKFKTNSRQYALIFPPV